jgi:hypothetical protein
MVPGDDENDFNRLSPAPRRNVMKRNLFYLLALLGVILIVGGGSAQAQIAESVDATIPFPFHAGGKELPAGAYTIRSTDSADGSVMKIQSADGRISALFQTEESDVSAATKDNELIFDHVGDDYVLSRIVDADDRTGVEVFNPHSRKEDTAERATNQEHVLAFPRL